MKILLLFALLDIFGLISSPAWDANAKFSQNDLYILREKSILRGHYKDVASESNGALLSSARSNSFYRPNIDNSPLRNSLYFSDTDATAHTFIGLQQSIIVEFLQAYEINTIRFWMLDHDIRRVAKMQIFLIGVNKQIESLIYEGDVQPGVRSLKFPDQLVSKVKFYNNGGNIIDIYMSMIKIQAYYAF
ncbi:unnamed protein product (macronuclear) [Paramecium tetraurelia]|uniref:Uncharacterized protein n=1 Tax=Paramecium tetraurelia TaxID=5888 RepID=A0DA27_PARTE|nr:uncharacterized protein GSPATT00014826001 [Paramecium tetraurelia]CAK79894.1 unnamed protein product [Paramecium tetraurelia]|eukprot:XP_001447291.1 hypothetical protein (macronuclear) [Paramecium tetraurelia strain d4-2]